MRRETMKAANDRRACLVCGASGADTFILEDLRVVRVCSTCARYSEWVDWTRGVWVPCSRGACVSVIKARYLDKK